jgi:tRNA threonylcarbamoyladenosine biosynthesis protein TsaE
MTTSPWRLSLPDAAATENLGAAMARAFQAAAPSNAVVYWRGELGAGKTTGVRSLLRTLGVEGLIRSPTYTLVEVYRPHEITCVHVDLYRLRGPIEVDELGLRDYFDEKCLLLVEWADRGVSVLPPPDLEVRLTYHDAARQAQLAAGTRLGEDWLELLLKDTSLASYVPHLT